MYIYYLVIQIFIIKLYFSSQEALCIYVYSTLVNLYCINGLMFINIYSSCDIKKNKIKSKKYNIYLHVK